MTPNRHEIRFSSGATYCAAALYTPHSPGGRRLPCVVLGHGLAGTRALGLESVAEVFADAGLAALAFDYRHLGRSGGRPRQLVSVRGQLSDYRAAIQYVRALDVVDPDRIAVWGTALSSGHALNVAAKDARIAAAVLQLPYARPSTETVGVRARLRLAGVALIDQLGGYLGRPPKLLSLVGSEADARPLIEGPEHSHAIQNLAARGERWDPRIAARSLLQLALYRPQRSAPKVRCPTLYCIADRDTICPTSAALAMARGTPNAEVKHYDLGHFDVGELENLQRLASDQSDFLVRYLLVPGAAAARRQTA